MRRGIKENEEGNQCLPRRPSIVSPPLTHFTSFHHITKIQRRYGQPHFIKERMEIQRSWPRARNESAVEAGSGPRFF